MRISKTTLANGLTLLHAADSSTQMVTLNILYRVGSRNEHPDHTGFAHLFEHLMFGGSVNIPDFDEPLQQACGDNNAYTTEDYTNYYITLPAANVETAFWLESDRMLSLAFTPRSLEVQRKVVMEEFKLDYLNQPYGDLSHLLSALCYKRHPYRWPTIGLDLNPIATATMSQVKRFFHRFYRPDNAILAVVGNISWERTQELTRKWFGSIRPSGALPVQEPLPAEPPHVRQRRLTVRRDVPHDLLMMAFQIPPRSHPDFHACDMLTDVLSNGRSSRFTRHLVEERQLFLTLDAYVDPHLDPGLLIIEGVPAEGVSLTEAEQAVWTELDDLTLHPVPEAELQKQKNKYETRLAAERTNNQTLAAQLAYFELLGDVSRFDSDPECYLRLTSADLLRVARHTLTRRRSNVIFYRSIHAC